MVVDDRGGHAAHPLPRLFLGQDGKAVLAGLVEGAAHVVAAGDVEQVDEQAPLGVEPFRAGSVTHAAEGSTLDTLRTPAPGRRTHGAE